MPHIKLKTLPLDDCTIGRLECGDFSCVTLELPWRENQVNISCIPAGEYRYKLRFSPGKQYYVLELQDVPGRTYIQVHIGNFTHQIQGCILPGYGIKDIDRDGVLDVTDSEAAFNDLMDVAGKVGTIEIERG